MKIRNDIKKIISNSNLELDKIESEYQKALQSKRINLNLELSIKRFISELRSPLDYLADQINNDNSCNGKKVSFPLFLESEGKFKEFMRKNFPKLDKINPKLFDKLESIQYYKNPLDNEWMKNLSGLDNKYKHVTLDQQKLHSDGGVIVQGNGITIVARNIIMEKGGKIIDAGGNSLTGPQKLNKNSKKIVGNDGLLVSSFEKNEIRFEGISMPAIQVLKNMLNGVQKVIKILEN